MNKYIAAAAAVLSLAPGLALAGEATRPGCPHAGCEPQRGGHPGNAARLTPPHAGGDRRHG